MIIKFPKGVNNPRLKLLNVLVVSCIILQNISPGMKLWGVITEVNEKDVVVGLPGGLRGLVRSCEALDSFSDNKGRAVC